MHWVRSLYSRARRRRPPRSFFLRDPDTNTMAVSSLATRSVGEGIKGSSIKSTIINVNKNKMAEATGWATSAMRLTN